MKRSFLLVMALVLIAGMTLGSIDAQSSGRLVNLVIDGEQVFPRVSARLVGNRTMVPVRIIAEHLGADVEWIGATRQVEIVHDGFKIVLTIDQKEVLAGQTQTRMDVAPFIEDGTTLVPLRFVSEMLGAEVGWDQSTYTAIVNSPPRANPGEVHRLTDVRFEDENGVSTLVVETEGQASFNVVPLGRGDGPYPRLLVRLNNTQSDIVPAGFTLGGIMVRGRVTEPENSQATELVVELLESSSYEVRPPIWDPSSGKQELVIAFQDRVRDVHFHHGDAGAWVDVITTGGASYTAFHLDNPHRVVVDFPGLEPNSDIHGLREPVGQASIDQIRLALFESSPPVTRLVLDTDEKVNYDVERRSSGFRVHLHGYLEEVKAESHNGKALLSVRTSLSSTPEVEYHPDKGSLVVDLPRITKNATANLDWNLAGPLESVSVEETPMKTESGQHVLGTRITMGLANYGGHTLSSDPGELRLVASGAPLDGRLIVLDPGHGGSDFGAIGPSGTPEKTVTLAVANRLKDLLEAAGATVNMTRYGDEHLGLYERVAIANDLKADLLLSIHFNGSVSSSVRGTETYYADTHPESVVLARITHNRLLADLGLPDRLMRFKREFVMVREPKMPSVLVEPAYLTNPTEEQMIRDPQFQARVAASLFESIKEFLSR